MQSLIPTLKEPRDEKSLSEVRQVFEHWRMSRPQIGPIPEELWKAAVNLCRSHPLSKVSQSLRLSYVALRKRVERLSPEVLSVRNSSKMKKHSKCTTTPTFVDISPHGNLPMPECSMEIRDGDGFSMKMQCRGEIGVDVLALCRIVIDGR